MIRTAISPRLATSTFPNMRLDFSRPLSSAKYLRQRYDGCPPASRLSRSVAVGGHERSSRQNLAHRRSLYAYAAPVNDSKRFESQAFCFSQILFHHPLHVAGWNAVKVEHVRDWYADRLAKWIANRIERHASLP